MNPSTFNNMVPIAPASTSTTFTIAEDLHKKKRTRAKRSCDLCRIKKTRCDAVGNQPCTKCRLAKTECLFLVEQKKRGPATGSYVETLEARLLRMEKLLQDMAKGKQTESENKSDRSHDSNDRSPSDSPFVGCASFSNENVDYDSDGDTEEIMPARFSTCPMSIDQDNSCDTLEEGLSKLKISDYQRTRYIGASSGVHFLGDKLLLSGKKHRIPHEPSWFVQKLNDDIDEHVIMKSKEIIPSELTPSDQYVSNRIVLLEDTPYLTQQFTDYLIDIYFNRVHVYCPMINKAQFLEEYYFHKPTPPDKYLLFAIVTIGTSIFLTERSATTSFNFTEDQIFEIYTVMKAKSNKLLNITHKRSMISTVQALMLLSMFVGHDDDDEEDTSHWFITGMAIRMAQDLGLHRDCSNWDIPDYEIELRKRIWYSAYMMDRWVAAELGRPVTILDHEFDVELPSPYELNMPFSNHTYGCTPSLILETETSLAEKKPVYACFLHLITLSQIAGQVLVGFHSTRAKKYRHENISLLNVLDRSLTNWKLSLPNELRWDVAKNNAGVVNSAACVLNIACDCTWILLYRPFIKTFEQETEITAWEGAVKALSICTASATDLVATAERMEYRAFVALPWNVAVYSVFQAAIIFLHNAKGENDFIKEQGKKYLRRCARLYNRDSYLRKTRVVKVLQQYMANYEIYMDDDSSNSSNNSRQSSSSPCIGERRRRSEDQPSILIAQLPKQIEESNITPESSSLIAAAIHPPHSSTTITAEENKIPEVFNPFSTNLNPLNTDLYLSSLTFGFHKSDLNGMTNVQQPDLSLFGQQQHQQQQQQQGQVNNEIVNQTLCMNATTNGMCDNQFNTSPYASNPNDFSQCPSLGLAEDNGMKSTLEENSNKPQPQFDLASLCSQIPIWDLPSGVTWNEWESFFKV